MNGGICDILERVFLWSAGSTAPFPGPSLPGTDHNGSRIPSDSGVAIGDVFAEWPRPAGVSKRAILTAPG